jgi:1,2-diacylglycerol 3-beta-glucosyltransferase
MTNVFQYFLVAIAIYLTFYVLYSLFLVVTALIAPRKETVIAPPPKTRFSVIIPAHNEELLLPRLLESLSKQHYPEHLFNIYVVADNCSDNTALIGRDNGATVLERSNCEFRGKGYAIKYALETINSSNYDAVFIVDADSIVEAAALRNLDLAIQKGARVIQCYNGVANPNDSWFTRLMDVSRTISNQLLEPSKERLGLSSHLMGNGMCFIREVISKYGWDSFTVGEDWEYYAKIVLQGERVAFVNKARLYHQESADLKQATPQRLRWSSGRFAVALKHGSKLFFQGLLTRSILKIDAALPLLLPNPSLGISLTLIFLLLSAIYAFLGHRVFFFNWFVLLTILQFFVFLVGVWHTKNKRKNLVALLFAPIFLLWKTTIDLLSLVGFGRRLWVRTERKL